MLKWLQFYVAGQPIDSLCRMTGQQQPVQLDELAVTPTDLQSRKVAQLQTQKQLHNS
jgi:hypothetical protein